MAQTRTFNPGLLAGLSNTTGTWTLTTAANLNTYNHTAAAETSTANIPVPRGYFGNKVQNAVSKVEVAYTVGTSALTGAPTAVLDKYTYAAATGAVTQAAVAQALTFAGDDTVGTATTTTAHIAVVAPTSITQYDDDTELMLELSFPCAAGTVLKITAVRVTYA